MIVIGKQCGMNTEYECMGFQGDMHYVTDIRQLLTLTHGKTNIFLQINPEQNTKQKKWIRT